MMIQDGDKVIVGPLDIVCVLHDVKTGRFHAAFFEEAPMPGPVGDIADLTVVRLKSKIHHTEGAPTLEEALTQMDETLLAKMTIADENVVRKAINWDGDLGVVLIVPNWRRPGSAPLEAGLGAR